jgi:transcriptional regulator with XRE-family HTH domain
MNTQVLLFQHIKSVLPPHLSMADEMADLLGISPDSAYRRIRGEKPISLEELEKVCLHYHVSMDQFLHLKTDSFLFSGKIMEERERSFDDYLDNFLQQLMFMNSMPKKHVYWILKDIPPISHFHIPELSLFKFYMWTKSILHYDSMKGVKFDFRDKRYDAYMEKSRNVLDAFSKVPITEIWNVESINSSLRQLRFHYDTGSFKSKADVLLLFDKLRELIDHFELQAEAGVKFRFGGNPLTSTVDYNMFVNELILGDNTAFFETDHMRLTFLNHSVLYFVYTRDERFNNRMYENIQNLINKSTMISKVGEKERTGFFNHLREEIDKRRWEIEG